MRVAWRLPLLLSACVVLGRLFPRSPLIDVATGSAPADVRLSYPIAHVLLAPLTLLADWLNGSPARELEGFALWILVGFACWRVLRRRAGRPAAAPALRGELAAAALLCAAAATYLAWGALAPRPIPRLVAAPGDALVFDAHSHTSASHDGRRGFDASANAAWHARAGFDAAFVTDHNTTRAIREWNGAAPAGAALLLPGVELSLSGLHLLVLGAAPDVANAPFRESWRATGRLVRALAAGDVPTPDTEPALPGERAGAAPDSVRRGGPPVTDGGGARTPPLLVPSLPEYWRHHWGADLDTLLRWGVAGLEIWTTSPRAMDFPAALRRAVVARCRQRGLALLGATDMHGIGYTASVWNVTRMPGWREMSAASLGVALIERLRGDGAAANRVVAMRRWLPENRAEAVVAPPVNLLLLLRTATPAHAAALLGWIWAPALLTALRRRRRS